MIPKNIQIDDYYITSDLALATAISLWFPIIVIDKVNPQKAEFIFQREMEIDGIVEAFWKKELKVDALSYFSQLKVIKARLYER